jgi:class 3 adenylate cyclase
MTAYKKYIPLLLSCLFWSIILLSQPQNNNQYQPSLSDSSLVLDLFERGGADNLEEALLWSRNIKYINGEKKALKALAEIYQTEGRSAAALRYSLERINLLKEIGNQKEGYQAEIFAGDIYYSEKLFDRALNYYHRANRMVSSEDSKIDLWEKIAYAYDRNNKPDSALFFHQRAYEYHLKDGNISAQLANLQSMSKIHDKTGNCLEALSQNQQIRDLIVEKNKSEYLATTYNNIGYNYHCLDDYKNALLSFEKADSLCLDDCDLDQIALHSNMGIAYFNYGQFKKAVRHFDTGIDIAKKEKNDKERAHLTYLKATVYQHNNDLYQALIFNEDAMKLAQKIDEKNTLANTYLLAAEAYEKLYEYELALDFYQKYLELRNEIREEEKNRRENILQQQVLLERAEKEIKLLLASQELQDAMIKQLQLEKDNSNLENERLLSEAEREKVEKEILLKEKEIQAARLQAKELEAEQNRQQLLLAKQELQNAEKQREIEQLKQQEEVNRLALLQKEAEEAARKKEIENLNQQAMISQLEIEKQNERLQSMVGLGIALLAILGLMLFGVIYSRRKNRMLEKERAKSEELLLNILPSETARELKQNGVATPKHYKKSTVLFTDFEGFTALSAQLPPEEIIDELNICFLAFDEIIERHGLEKIKTIGDAYMCVGGLPIENESNPQDAVAAGLEMQKFIENRYAEKKAQGKPYWKMRLGIHTGEVVAGVVGSKKFAYDIWGDTVNLANRMETNGESGKINISKSTYELVKDQFKCQSRGAISVKNKGDMEMYFVEG